MYNRDTEIREAVAAGEKALHSLKEAKKSLGSARKWGIFDLLGGKNVSGVMKHIRIGDAKNSLERAKSDLYRFSRELNDVRELEGLNIEIGNFLTFADFFFDGFLADIMVQSRIKKAQGDIDEAILRVENILGALHEYGRY